MTPIDAENMMSIDRLALDKEWLRQPGLYASISLQLAEARSELDMAKSNIILVDAEVDQKVRANPERYGIEKITEKPVAAAVAMHSKMKKAQEEFLTAKYEVDLLVGLQQALEHRKESLKALTTLHLNDYYGSGPASVPRHEAQAIAEQSRGERRKKGQTENIPRRQSSKE